MKNNTQALREKLIQAEVQNDDEDFINAYRTLRRAVLEHLGISMEDINEEVNKAIEEKIFN
jgi:hypothetical protein